ncbi:MAG: peptidoglycan-binding domain-containing protein [Terriglobia bacterium]
MQPERAEQIQQALIDVGDLHESPTGRWDAQTRDAMRQYQQQHGFQTTGLPDAKSLMKLGLGPHPLPPDADPVAQAKSFPPTTSGDKSADTGSQQDPPQD